MKVRVTGILVQGDEILLLNQDTDNGRSWSLPGGKVEEGETLEAALIREMKEETGLIIQPRNLLYVCDYFNDNSHVLHISFSVDQVGGELGSIESGLDSQEIRCVRLVPISDLPDKGFSQQFTELVQRGFPQRGNYMGLKSNIGL